VTIKPSSIDTPFYSHGRSRLGVRPHPVSRIYRPEKVARAILAAAERPRRDVYVGVMGKLLAVGERLSPRLMDWYMLQRNELFRQQMSEIPDRGESNLYSSPEETRINGDFRDEER
jgi:short-subunit dehydrogenase